MALTYGFYNALNHDRVYDAVQMSQMFDGVVEDGVFKSVGDTFEVSVIEDMTVGVASGRAWFNHTWTLNDATIDLEIPAAESIYNRYDAVVLEIDSSVEVRANAIKIVSGTPANQPLRPSMEHSETFNQYALAYIYVPAGATAIRAADIVNVVGDPETPYARIIDQDIELITDEYDPTKSYKVGDYCSKKNVLYRCTGNTSGDWDSSKWSSTTTMDEVDDYLSILANDYDESTSYNSGDRCIYAGKLYHCVADTSGVWDPSKWIQSTAMDEIEEHNTGSILVNRVNINHNIYKYKDALNALIVNHNIDPTGRYTLVFKTRSNNRKILTSQSISQSRIIFRDFNFGGGSYDLKLRFWEYYLEPSDSYVGEGKGEIQTDNPSIPVSLANYRDASNDDASYDWVSMSLYLERGIYHS